MLSYVSMTHWDINIYKSAHDWYLRNGGWGRGWWEGMGGGGGREGKRREGQSANYFTTLSAGNHTRASWFGSLIPRHCILPMILRWEIATNVKKTCHHQGEFQQNYNVLNGNHNGIVSTPTCCGDVNFAEHLYQECNQLSPWCNDRKVM